MRAAATAVLGYALMLLVLLGAYRWEATRYRPHRPIGVDLPLRQAGLCVALVSLGLAREGLELCHRALAARPDSAQVRFWLGAAYASEDRVFEAMAAYREAIRYRPDYAEAHANLGMLLARLGRLEEASAELRRAADLPEARRQLRRIERHLATRAPGG